MIRKKIPLAPPYAPSTGLRRKASEQRLRRTFSLKNSRRGLQALLKPPLSPLQLIQFEKPLLKPSFKKFKEIILGALVTASLVKTSVTTRPYFLALRVFWEKSIKSACRRLLGPSAALFPRLLGFGASTCLATLPSGRPSPGSPPADRGTRTWRSDRAFSRLSH